MPLKVIKSRTDPDGCWYVRGTVRGRRIEESTGTRKRSDAEAFKTRRETELYNEAIHGRAAVSTFAHAAAGYLAAGGESRFLTPIIKHFGTTMLAKIDQSAVDACAKALMPAAKSSTVARQIHTPISAVLQFGASRNMCAPIRLKRPRSPKGKTRWLTPAEAGRLVAACSPHLRPIVVLMLYTGARCSEALYLDWNEVNLSAGQVAYLDTKNGEDRGVPLHPAALAELANLPHRIGAVFRRPDGMPYEIKDDEGGQIKTAFLGACKRAGLAWPRVGKDGKQRKDKQGRLLWKTDVTPHTCRHTWASWHYAAHRDLRQLMELGGWNDASMVQRYTHVNVSNHAPSIAALPDLGDIWGSADATASEATQNQKVKSR